MNIDQRSKAWNLAVFMRGENIVLIHDEEEMKHFVDLMQYHRIDCFSHQKGCEQWRHYGPFFSLITALQNRHLISEGFDGKTLYVEFQGDKGEFNMGAFDDQTREWYKENGSMAHAEHILRNFYEGTMNAFVEKRLGGLTKDAQKLLGDPNISVEAKKVIEKLAKCPQELMDQLKVPDSVKDIIKLYIEQKPFEVSDIDDRR